MFRPPSDISLRYSAAAAGIELASAAVPPAGHAGEAFGTACSSHTTEEKKGGTKNGYNDRTSEVKCLKGLDFVGKEGEDGQ